VQVLDDRGLRGADAAHLLSALAQLHPRVPAPEVPRLAAAVTADAAAAADVTSLASAAWALAIMRQLDTVEAKALVARLASRLEDDDVVAGLKASEQRKLYHAHLLARHAGAAFAVPQDAVDSSAGAWMRELPTGEGAVHLRLERLLDIFGFEHTMAPVVDEDSTLVPDAIVERGGELPPLAVLLTNSKAYLRGPGVPLKEARAPHPQRAAYVRDRPAVARLLQLPCAQVCTALP
jgi:hypothetical protein